jgi:hypothetical protein
MRNFRRLNNPWHWLRILHVVKSVLSDDLDSQHSDIESRKVSTETAAKEKMLSCDLVTRPDDAKSQAFPFYPLPFLLHLKVKFSERS